MFDKFIALILVVSFIGMGSINIPRVEEVVVEPTVESVNYIIEENEVHQDIVEIVDANQDLVFHSYKVNGIPTLEVYQENGQVKPLVMMLHGLNGYKEGNAYLMAMLAKNGYHAVSIDNQAHGDRESKEMSFYGIIKDTMYDVETVLAYYDSLGMLIDNNFVVGGFSMGGMISYMLGAYSSYQPKMIVGISSLGDFESIANSYLMSTRVKDGIAYQDDSFKEENMIIASEVNPAKNIEGFKDNDILIYHSHDDSILPYANEESFYNMLMESGMNVEMVSFADAGHSVPNDFIKVLIERLNEVFK